MFTQFLNDISPFITACAELLGNALVFIFAICITSYGIFLAVSAICIIVHKKRLDDIKRELDETTS